MMTHSALHQQPVPHLSGLIAVVHNPVDKLQALVYGIFLPVTVITDSTIGLQKLGAQMAVYL